MSDSLDQRAIMVTVGFNLTPPLIRESLLEKREFREKYGFVTDGTVSFGDNIVSFQRSVIFNAIRNVFVKESTIELIDNKGQKWHLAIDKYDQELPQLLLSRDQQQLSISDLLGLSNDAATRIRFFEESASDVNLPSSAQKEWLSILAERALEDEEVAVLQEDICDTPIHIMRLIRSEITGGTGNISSLVPNSRKYFERLVGIS